MDIGWPFARLSTDILITLFSFRINQSWQKLQKFLDALDRVVVRFFDLMAIWFVDASKIAAFLSDRLQIVTMEQNSYNPNYDRNYQSSR
jgi:hypothetical protein